jgi:hypothetical protein
MGLRRRSYLVEGGWMEIRRFFPKVRDPLFHGTKRAYKVIAKREGLVPQEGGIGWKHDKHKGVSLTRTFDVAKQFGHHVLVIDRSKLAKKKLKPFHYAANEFPMPDEAEEKYVGKIPFSAIGGVVFDDEISPRHAEQMQLDKLPFPVVEKWGGPRGRYRLWGAR